MLLLQVLSELVEQCSVSDVKENNMFATLHSMGDNIGVCDKLLRYPIPLAYTRHTSRFMIIWLSAMPFTMWDICGWGVVPLTTVIAYLLLGIDEIGVQIEEPFGILPLEDMVADIHLEIDAMVDRQDIVTDLLRAGGVDCDPRSSFDEYDHIMGVAGLNRVADAPVPSMGLNGGRDRSVKP